MFHPYSADLARLRGTELEWLARRPDRLVVHELEVARPRPARRLRRQAGR